MRMFNPVLNPELAGFFGDNMEFDDNWSKNSQNVVIDSNTCFICYLLVKSDLVVSINRPPSCHFLS